MADGRLRAVVATSSLDLGIDWGGVDQVLQVGAPKGVSRAAATGRPRQPPHGRALARHPGARQPLRGAGMRGRDPRRRRARARRRPAAPGRAGRAGAAHARAWPAPRRSCPTTLFAEVPPRRALRRACRAPTSTTCCASSRTAATRWPPMSATASCSATPRAACMSARERIARQHRMNIGTIVEAPLLKVRLRRARRRHARRGRGILRQHAAPRRHLHVRRPPAALPAHPRDRRGGRRTAATASRWCPPMPAGGCR